MRRTSTPNTRVRISDTALVRTDTHSNLFFFIFSCNEKGAGFESRQTSEQVCSLIGRA